MQITKLLLAELDREAVGIRKTLERVLVGQAQRASRGLYDITCQPGSLPHRVAREEHADSQPLSRG